MSRLWTFLLVLLAVAAGVFLFIIEPRWKSTRETAASRDRVLPLDFASLRAVRITTGDTGFELTRKDDGWHVGPEPKDAASPEAVAALLQAAVDLRALALLTAGDYGEGRDLDDLGLERPRNRIDFIGDGNSALLLGKDAAGDDRIYVRRADSKEVFVVAADLQDLALRKPEEFRDRRLSRLTPEEVDRFEIRRDGGEIAVERVGAQWEITRPFRAPADAASVERFLSGIFALPIEAFVADGVNDLSAQGLGSARAELVVHVEGRPAPVALRIGSEAEGGRSVLAQFTARDSIYRLPATAWEALQIAPGALRDRRLLSLNLDTVDALRLRRGGEDWMLERAGEGWAVGGQPVAADAVEGFVRGLNEARVTEYLPLTQANLEAAGLDRPVAEVTFDAWLSENTPEATAGRRAIATLAIGATREGRTFVRLGEAPEICAVPADAIGNLPR